MDLFEQESVYQNRLPYDGTVLYLGQIFSAQQARSYFDALLHSIAWQHDEAIIYGKHIITKRKVAWYAEHPFAYTYSRTTKRALAWNPMLLELKKCVEQLSAERFNSCLLNLYHDGTEAMAWHSDAEIDLKQNGTIASLSFGAKRKFVFKHKQSKAKVEIDLPDGSLLLMKNQTQTHWLHRLPASKSVSSARINLTFRQIANF